MSSYVAQLTTNPAASAASTIARMLCMVAFKLDLASPRVSAPRARFANPKHFPGHSRKCLGSEKTLSEGE